MQRVALARALVNRPQVLLLDEPLSALDLKIRLEMEEELRRVHRETGATFVYVTHDQREALALSDRIVVFDQGRIEQLGTPERRSTGSRRRRSRPGSSATRTCSRWRCRGTAAVEPRTSRPAQSLSVPCERRLPAGDAWLVLRPEVVRLGAPDGAGLRGTVRDLAFRGSGFGYRLEIAGLAETLKAEVPAEAGRPHELGSDVVVEFDPDSCVLLPRAGRQRSRRERAARLHRVHQPPARRLRGAVPLRRRPAGRVVGGVRRRRARPEHGTDLRTGPEPSYLAVWHTASAGIERIGDWEAVFASGEADRLEETFKLGARIDDAGCYEPLLEPVHRRGGLYVGEFLDFAPDATRDDVRSFYEARRAASERGAEPALRPHRQARAGSPCARGLERGLVGSGGRARARARRRRLAGPPRHGGPLPGPRAGDALIGFAGLGSMGGPMAGNAARAGFRVAGFDPQPERVAAAEAAGVEPAASLAELASGSGLLVASVPGPPSSRRSPPRCSRP